MFRSLLIVFFCTSILTASDSGRLYELYQNGKYRQACDEGVSKLQKHRNDEKYISLYAFACLQADEVDRLALPIIMLKKSRGARKNATYFSTILLQKNLLIDALENRQSLSGLNLPSTDFVLSKVFDLFSANRYVSRNDIYVLTDPKNPRQTYRLYLRAHEKSYALVLDEYYDTILTKHHLYR
jgi:hypothetical protein